MLKTIVLALCTAGATLGATIAAQVPQEDGHDMHMLHGQQNGAGVAEDTRTLVQFPEMLRIHMLANMRDHLLALSEIQEALAREEFDQAGAIAEQRLGMTSLKLHGAHEVGQYMPQEMAAIGTEMHRAASRFAVAADNAAVGGDVKPALAALSRVTRACVACHSGYRVQ